MSYAKLNLEHLTTDPWKLSLQLRVKTRQKDGNLIKVTGQHRSMNIALKVRIFLYIINLFS